MALSGAYRRSYDARNDALVTTLVTTLSSGVKGQGMEIEPLSAKRCRVVWSGSFRADLSVTAALRRYSTANRQHLRFWGNPEGETQRGKPSFWGKPRGRLGGRYAKIFVYVWS